MIALKLSEAEAKELQKRIAYLTETPKLSRVRDKLTHELNFLRYQRSCDRRMARQRKREAQSR